MTDSTPPRPQAANRADNSVICARIVEFVRLARADHFRVGVQEAIDALSVAERVGVADPSQLRWGLRSLLCSNAAD